MKIVAIITLAALALLGYTLAEGDATTATIGRRDVPSNLNCEEDEVITFVQDGTPPYEIGCVHIEVIAREVVAPL